MRAWGCHRLRATAGCSRAARAVNEKFVRRVLEGVEQHLFDEISIMIFCEDNGLIGGELFG